MKYLNILLVNFLLISMAWSQCYTDLPSTAPNQRFEVHNDGTATDLVTGLMWQRCPNNWTWNGEACEGRTDDLQLHGALQIAASSRVGGYDDWRVPNIKELMSLIEFQCDPQRYNAEVFYIDSGDNLYGSSSISGEFEVYEFNFFTGKLYSSSTNSYSVWRFVRDPN